MVFTEDLVTIIEDVKQILGKNDRIERDTIDRLKKILLHQNEIVIAKTLHKKLTSLYHSLTDKASENSELIYFIILLVIDDRLFPRFPILRNYMDCIFVSKDLCFVRARTNFG